MRLFTGLDLPSDIESKLERLLDVLRPQAPGFTWTPLANLHITTKFIGEWPDDRIEDLQQALRGVAAGPMAIPVRGVGWFPNPHQPRFLFAAVDAQPALLALARGTRESLAALGVEREDRKYTPHVTLARVTQGSELAPVRQAIARHDSLDFGVFEAKSFYLYSSRSTAAQGSVYAKLAEFPLQ